MLSKNVREANTYIINLKPILTMATVNHRVAIGIPRYGDIMDQCNPQLPLPIPKGPNLFVRQ